MLLQRFEDRGLSHYSYAIGCPKARRLAVIDPRRDIGVYLDFATERGMSIAYVLETHIHADYASGALQLAEEAGAELCLSSYDEGETYEVSFPHTELSDGDAVDVGIVRLEVLHTPGHTPEHISFLAYDESRSREIPVMLFSGDFLFVGSVGRPDLLGEEVKQRLAEQLYWSIQDKIDGLPDGVEVHPAHGAGSLCGAGMGTYPSSTLGFERDTNPYLTLGLSREEFCRRLLSSLPPQPTYYRRMKQLNSEGPPPLEYLPGQTALPLHGFAELMNQGYRILDVRSPADFAAGHIPGSVSIGMGNDLSTWAGWLLSPDEALILVTEKEGDAEAAARALVRVGLDRIDGHLKGGVRSWSEAGNPIETTAQITAKDLHEALQKAEGPAVIDVRTAKEWQGGHIEGALHLPLGELPQRLEQLPEGPLAVTCATGYRSTIACSLLQADERDDVSHLSGGMTAWKGAGLPVAAESRSAPPPEAEVEESDDSDARESVPPETDSTPEAATVE